MGNNNTKNVITKETLIHDLENLGIQKGDRLNVKASLKSIGHIEGGANALIEALLYVVGANGTIFTDSFVKDYSVKELRKHPDLCLVDENTPSYAGALANAMHKYPNAQRSPHPIQKFVGIGADAGWVLDHDVDSEPYSVLHRLAMEGGKNLKIGEIGKVHGVGTTHCAIETLKWRQKMPVRGVSYKKDGKNEIFYHNWPTGCMKAFDSLMSLYELNGGIIAKGRIGNSPAYLTDMRKTYELEVMLGRYKPEILKCDDPNCYRCRLGWEHRKDNVAVVLWFYVSHLKIRTLLQSIKMLLCQQYEPRS